MTTKQKLPNWFKKRIVKRYCEIQLWMVAIGFFVLGIEIGLILAELSK